MVQAVWVLIIDVIDHPRRDRSVKTGDCPVKCVEEASY